MNASVIDVDPSAHSDYQLREYIPELLQFLQNNIHDNKMIDNATEHLQTASPELLSYFSKELLDLVVQSNNENLAKIAISALDYAATLDQCITLLTLFPRSKGILKRSLRSITYQLGKKPTKPPDVDIVAPLLASIYKTHKKHREITTLLISKCDKLLDLNFDNARTVFAHCGHYIVKYELAHKQVSFFEHILKKGNEGARLLFEYGVIHEAVKLCMPSEGTPFW
jgi:hypothetical protein